MLDERLAMIDCELVVLEARNDAPLSEVLEPAIAAVAATMRAFIDADGRRPAPAVEADVLEVWRALAKGDPTWNAIRDNCRELVYYRNCLAMDRADALPPAAARMAVRTARHIHLYVRTRALRVGRAADG